MARTRDQADREALTALWERRWPDTEPVGYELGRDERDTWVRFHSLPESKRYPDDEREYAIVLERHNTVLDELFTGSEVHVMVPRWSDRPSAPRMHWDTRHWRSWLCDEDPEFPYYCHVFVERRPWRRGSLDRLLRRVADDREGGVIIAGAGLRRLYHPYDGGADVYLTTAEERDRLKERHFGWLSVHPSGW
ncbi:DUF3885 domain-containing protein [Kitasatospora brasiliensis]|uniref:DUF3885 domain-containing protein n=1 Tax=Kitasatospora brasiliensis TaxID=3058040 RepID=UPI002931A82F|nr:hypothetical protein [Kitasatospora sp. K002]